MINSNKKIAFSMSEQFRFHAGALLSTEIKYKPYKHKHKHKELTSVQKLSTRRDGLMNG